MENVQLSKTDQEIINFLIQQRSKQIFPSLREIGNAVGLRSSSTVHTHIKRLTKLGVIDRNRLESRSIRIHLVEDQICPCCLGSGTITPIEPSELPKILSLVKKKG